MMRSTYPLYRYWPAFLTALDRLAPTRDDEARVDVIARACGWTTDRTVQVAHELVHAGWIVTDAGMGEDPTSIEGRG